MIGRIPRKTTKQSSITSVGFPVLQKPTEMCVGRQIQVLGSYWTGCMSNEEVMSLYNCTVPEYPVLNKWDTGGTPSQSMELQEMVVDGQGIRETGGFAADRIFFMTYPMPFLQHWYVTYPPPQHRTQRPWTDHRFFQLFSPHLLVWTQTWQVKAPRESLTPTSHTCPRGRLF